MGGRGGVSGTQENLLHTFACKPGEAQTGGPFHCPTSNQKKPAGRDKACSRIRNEGPPSDIKGEHPPPRHCQLIGMDGGFPGGPKLGDGRGRRGGGSSESSKNANMGHPFAPCLMLRTGDYIPHLVSVVLCVPFQPPPPPPMGLRKGGGRWRLAAGWTPFSPLAWL